MSRLIHFLVTVVLLVLPSCNRDPEAAKQSLLASGNKYFEAGKYKEASILYRKAIQKDFRFGEAHYRLALTELQLGRVAEAVSALEHATEIQPSNEDAFAKLADLYLAIYFANPASAKQTLERTQQLTVRAERNLPQSFHLHRVKGFVGLTQKEYKNAIESFRQAMRVRPDDGPVALGLAEGLTAAGRSEEAEKLAKDFIQKQKSFTGMYDFLWIRYFRSDRFEEAEQVLESKCRNNPSQDLWRLQLALHHHLTGNRQKRNEVVDGLLKSSNSPETYDNVGDFYVRIGEYASAVNSYQKGVEAAPDRKEDFQKKMVESLALQGKNEEAFQLVQQVLTGNSKDSQALAMRGALRLRAGDKNELESTIADLEAAMASMPENPVVRFNLGEAYLARGERDRAIVEFQAALKRSPNYLPPRYGLAKAYMAAGNFARVVAVAEEILAIHPDDLTAKMARAGAWLGMGKLDLARNGFEEVVRQAPDALEAVYRIAVIDLNNRKWDEAEAGFRRLVEAKPPDSRGVLGLAEVEIARGRPDRAVRLVQSRIDQDPEDITWRRVMGNVAARAGNEERALRELNLVLSKHPDDASVHQQVAHVYLGLRKYTEAEQHLRSAIKLQPRDPSSNLTLAIVLENQGEPLKAVPYYEKTVEAEPENTIALNNLAFILAETTDDLDRALSLAQRARSRAPDFPDITDTLAWIYIKKNLNESAISLLGELVSRHPDKPAWRYHLAVAYYQKGDNSRARKELETALQRKPSEQEEGQIRQLLAKIKG